MKICPKCNHENENFARFCSRCGSPLDNSSYQYTYTNDSFSNKNLSFSTETSTNYGTSYSNNFSNTNCPVCNTPLTGTPTGNIVLCSNCGSLVALGEPSIGSEEIEKLFPVSSSPLSINDDVLKHFNIGNDEVPVSIHGDLLMIFNNINKNGYGVLLITNKKLHFDMQKFKFNFPINSVLRSERKSDVNNKSTIILFRVIPQLNNFPNMVELRSNSEENLTQIMKIVNYLSTRYWIIMQRLKKEGKI